MKKVKGTRMPLRAAFIAAALLLLPSLVFAAGFAKQSLFLSKSPVTEGDTVHIYAVLSNSAAAKFSGTVVFKDGDQKVGSAAVAIDAGGAQTTSVSWKPTAGSHSIVAELTDSSSAVVESESATFAINEKPKPAAMNAFPTASDSAATVESSQNIQKQIGSLSPQVESASKPLFTVIDGLRSSAADVIDGQISNAKSNIAATPKTGIVAGASTTEDAKVNNPWGTGLSVLWTLYLYVLTVARFLVGNAGVFYPLLAVIFFYLLWKMYRRFRRPSY